MTAVTLPGESGLAYAMRRAYHSWRETQPQLFWTDENLYDGLEGGDVARAAGCRASGCGVVSLEPVLDTHPPEVADGLASISNGFGHALHDEDMRGRSQEGA